MGKLVKLAVLVSLLGGMSTPVFAQNADVSPTLFIESMPSDNAKYRRMVYVRYLSGASYKAYNRREFNTATSSTSAQAMRQCANGTSSSLQEIKAFEKAERRRSQSGQAPEYAAFCIKNVRNWNAKNKDEYLDPIFNGMPYVAP